VEETGHKSSRLFTHPIFDSFCELAHKGGGKLGLAVGKVWVEEDGGSWRLYFWQPDTDLEYVPELTEKWLVETELELMEVFDDMFKDVLLAFERGGDEHLYKGTRDAVFGVGPVKEVDDDE
jgi:hypothetical protein